MSGDYWTCPHCGGRNPDEYVDCSRCCKPDARTAQASEIAELKAEVASWKHEYEIEHWKRDGLQSRLHTIKQSLAIHLPVSPAIDAECLDYELVLAVLAVRDCCQKREGELDVARAQVENLVKALETLREYGISRWPPDVFAIADEAIIKYREETRE